MRECASAGSHISSFDVCRCADAFASVCVRNFNLILCSPCVRMRAHILGYEAHSLNSLIRSMGIGGNASEARAHFRWLFRAFNYGESDLFSVARVRMQMPEGRASQRPEGAGIARSRSAGKEIWINVLNARMRRVERRLQNKSNEIESRFLDERIGDKWLEIIANEQIMRTRSAHKRRAPNDGNLSKGIKKVSTTQSNASQANGILMSPFACIGR